MAFLPLNFIHPGIISRLTEYEKNLQITEPKTHHVSFKNGSYLNNIFQI